MVFCQNCKHEIDEFKRGDAFFVKKVLNGFLTTSGKMPELEGSNPAEIAKMLETNKVWGHINPKAPIFKSKLSITCKLGACNCKLAIV